MCMMKDLIKRKKEKNIYKLIKNGVRIKININIIILLKIELYKQEAKKMFNKQSSTNN